MAKNKHIIIVQEILRREVEVEAETEQEAFDIVISMYRNEEIVLDAEDLWSQVYLNKKVSKI